MTARRTTGDCASPPTTFTSASAATAGAIPRASPPCCARSTPTSSACRRWTPVPARPAKSMQMHYLAAVLGLHAVAGPTLLRPGGDYGNALLDAAPRARRPARRPDRLPSRAARRARRRPGHRRRARCACWSRTSACLPGERRTQVRRLLDLLGREPIRRRRPVRRHQRMVRGRASPALAARAPGTDRRRRHLSGRISGIRARSDLGPSARRRWLRWPRTPARRPAGPPTTCR